MRYWILFAKDLSFNQYAFHEEADGLLRLKNRYDALRCTRCGKIDEIEALRAGGVEIFGFRPKYEFMATLDGVFLLSKRCWNVIADNRFRGIEPIELSQTTTQYCAIYFQPEFVRSHSMKGIKRYRLCDVCGRYGELKGMPPIDEIDIPSEKGIFFTTKPFGESPMGWEPTLFVSEDVLKVFRKEKVKGFEAW
jgi:hypothetical protein